MEITREMVETYGYPEAFVEKMQMLLGEEADVFFQSLKEERQYGMRFNPLKKEQTPECFGSLSKVLWAKEGYYYEESMRPGKHPFHEAGVYYIQEPSAMAVAEAMNPMPGERILDLCAAPGGKSTHLAGKMKQKGLLVCNEIHPARAKILSQNIERMGVANAIVTNMEPAGLTDGFVEFFDGIVVDAPCSGEGMFRKDEQARKEWSTDHVTLCAARQDMILDCAAQMLRFGGRIVYSTCTFSPEENEQTVVRFLKRHPEFHLEQPVCAEYFAPGRPEWAAGAEEVKKTVRIWPHQVSGEGHFLALLVKGETMENGQTDGWTAGGLHSESDLGSEGGLESERGATGLRSERGSGTDKGISTGKKKKDNGRGTGKRNGTGSLETIETDVMDFLGELLKDTDRPSWMKGKRLLTFGENVYLVPEESPDLKGIKVLRPGLHLGVMKKGRMEPSHALALFVKPEEVEQWVEIGTEERASAYLRGETIPLSEEQQTLKGWTLVTVGGYSIGFGKADRGILKNHYPKGLRRP